METGSLLARALAQYLSGYRVSSAGTDLAEPNADCEYDTTANDNLDDGVSELAAHETIANERL